MLDPVMSSSSSISRVPLSVADVYDIAADIGKEFEALIDHHGPDAVTPLMQKVISALEHLEGFAAETDAEKETIEQLKTTLKHLELEEAKRNEEKHRLNADLEQIEDHYKQETRDLLATVKRLQDENRKLASTLAAAAEAERDSAFSEEEPQSSGASFGNASAAYFEVDLVNRLETKVDKQRAELKDLEQRNLDLSSENEELKSRNEKLTICARDLRRKCRSVQNQLHEMADERAEMTAKLQESHRDMQILSRELGNAERDAAEVDVGLKDKLVYAQDDPNRPRFTLPELKEILQERNSLKARVSDLEDELAVFRPRTVISSTCLQGKVRMGTALATAKCDCSYHSRSGRGCGFNSVESDEVAKEAKENTGANDDEADDDAFTDDEEDLPVQGPLPQDPEDAPWRRNQESGIRKLFRRVFSPTAIEGRSIPNSVSTPASLNTAIASNPSPVNNHQSQRRRSSQMLRNSASKFYFLLGANPLPVNRSPTPTSDTNDIDNYEDSSTEE